MGEIPPEVATYAEDWPLPGRDYANSRATEDSTIDSTTVATLGPVWEVEMPGSAGYGNVSTTPLILGDTVYVQDLGSNVRAIDRATGALRWRADLASFTIGPNGVAVGWGRLYAADGTDDIVALDLATGAEVWRSKITRTETDGVDIQPTVFDRQVYASTVPVSLNGIYAGGDRGILQALDVETGELRWEFNTVIDDLWGNPEVNSGGGSWYTPAIDVERGRILWGVANPAPFPGTPEFPNGTSRPGPNLYTESVVAIEADGGALAWYRQAIPHDIFDHDLVHTMVVDVGLGTDRSHTIVVATGKGGRVLGHDRDTGELLWETPVGRHENDDLLELTGPTDVWPGTFGGVLTPPAHADGVVFVATLNAPTTLSPDVPAYIGSRIGTAPGQVVAIDAADGRILWDVEVAGDPTGATTVVNDLVFTATFQGTIYALDRATGATVWTWDAPGGINGWPAVADDLIVWPVGLANPPRLVALRVGANG